MSIASCCECCSSTTNSYDSSFEEYATTIMNCFAIQIEMSNGEQICQICIDKLSEANDFRNLILSTQEVLRNRKDNNIVCNNVAEIEFTPKEEYDENFEIINDFDDYFEMKPIKKEYDVYKNSLQNNLVLDFLKKSTGLVIKPVAKPVTKLVTKAVPKPVTEHVTIPVTKHVNIPVAKHVTIPVTKHVTIPVTKHVTEAVTKPVINKTIEISSKPQEKTVTKKVTKTQLVAMCPIPITWNKNISADNEEKHDNNQSKQLTRISKNSLPLAKRSRYRHDFIMPKLDDKDFICHECQKQFFNIKSLSVHMNDHYRNYICENCGKGFATKNRLDSHMTIHKATKNICKQCGKEFNTANNLTLHVKRTHDRVKANKCEICDEKFHHFYSKMKHMSDVHGQTHRKYKCPHCPVECLTGSKLTVHIRHKHIGRERRYFCDTCGDGFFAKNTLGNHMLKHTGSRDFKCHLCPKAYPRKNTLREHMRIHENDKRFKCEVCGQAFTQKCTLKGHMKVHEKQSSNR